MNVVTNAKLPTGMRKQRSYTSLIETLRMNGGWVAVSNSDVAGATKAQKQTAIHAACQRAGFRVETRTSEDRVFIRSLEHSGVIESTDTVNAHLPALGGTGGPDSVAGVNNDPA